MVETEYIQNLSTSIATANNIFKFSQASGEVDPKSPPKYDYLRKLDDYQKLNIIGLIFECPNLQLQGIAHKVKEITGTVVSTLCGLLGHHGFTHKVLKLLPYKESWISGHVL